MINAAIKINIKQELLTMTAVCGGIKFVCKLRNNSTYYCRNKIYLLYTIILPLVDLDNILGLHKT